MRDADRYLEVRCCCDPAKLLGLLPIPNEVRIADGQRVRWVPKREAAELTTWPPSGQLCGGGSGPMFLELEIAEWRDEQQATKEEVFLAREPLARVRRVDGGLAFKSDDTPLEVLRLVPGFIEPKRRGDQ